MLNNETDREASEFLFHLGMSFQQQCLLASRGCQQRGVWGIPRLPAEGCVGQSGERRFAGWLSVGMGLPLEGVAPWRRGWSWWRSRRTRLCPGLALRGLQFQQRGEADKETHDIVSHRITVPEKMRQDNGKLSSEPGQTPPDACQSPGQTLLQSPG